MVLTEEKIVKDDYKNEVLKENCKTDGGIRSHRKKDI